MWGGRIFAYDCWRSGRENGIHELGTGLHLRTWEMKIGDWGTYEKRACLLAELGRIACSERNLSGLFSS